MFDRYADSWWWISKIWISLSEHAVLIDMQAFDKNHDGYIDEHELRQTMHELGMKLSAEDIKSMMSQAGCRITGRVYYEGLLLNIIQFIWCTKQRSGLVTVPGQYRPSVPVY